MQRQWARPEGNGGDRRTSGNDTERVILSTIQQRGALPASEIARVTALSPQTVSVILRRLESDGLIARGEPIRGAVGKPRVPVALHPDGAFAIGAKIGRRTTDVILIDLTGGVRAEARTRYAFPEPARIFEFLEGALDGLSSRVPDGADDRLAGIGIGRPSELWNWPESVGATQAQLAPWRGVDWPAKIGAFSALPVFIDNDGTAACRAEHVFGHGRSFTDFAYIYIGAFIGGGIVLDGAVMEGRYGNAGGFGPLPSLRADGSPTTLIETASLHSLERMLEDEGQDGAALWTDPQDWSAFEDLFQDWAGIAADALARSVITLGAILDLEAVVIDGAMPRAAQARLVEMTRNALSGLDSAGVVLPRIEPGLVGHRARAIGAACKPIQAGHLMIA